MQRSEQEREFDIHVAPLMEQLRNACVKYKMPFSSVVIIDELRNAEGNITGIHRAMSHYLPESTRISHPAYTTLAASIVMADTDSTEIRMCARKIVQLYNRTNGSTE